MKILFVCHGNICRSPMAEFIFKKLARDAGRNSEFEVASAATSTEELGNDIYPPAKRCLKNHGIEFSSRAARQITKADYLYYDHIIVMDSNNLRNMRWVIGEDTLGKVSLMMSWACIRRDVADPWYTDDFETTYRDLLTGCSALLEAL